MPDAGNKLDQLERDGFVVVEGALSPDATDHVRGQDRARA